MNEYSMMRRWDHDTKKWIYLVVYGTETKVEVIAERHFSASELGDAWAEDLIKQKKLQ